LTLQIDTAQTDSLIPIPGYIGQADKQFLHWNGTQYAALAYITQKQKTKVKVPNNEVPDFTKLAPKSDGTEDPTKAGNIFTFGPYSLVKPEQKGGETISLRFEYTSPVIKMNKLERHIEVSHWGGNLAVEERYWMTNMGAK
jgi:oligosaccharyltransferase complex subunit alpha (ribophorin I)